MAVFDISGRMLFSSGRMAAVPEFVPEGTEKSIEAEGVKVSLVNKDGQFKIKIDNLEEQCKEDSEELKNCIATFKEKVDSLDDETFDELIKEFGESYNLQEFAILLDMECHSDKEATKLLEMIDKFTYYTRKNLKSKIEKLTLLYKKF